MPSSTQLIDLAPAAQQIRVLVAALDDEQLTAPTPCADYTVGDLLGHLLGLTLAFRLAAEKTPAYEEPQDERGAGTELPPDWRHRLRRQVDELVLRGWDLARAIGQPFRCDPVHVEAVLGFTTAAAEAGPQARAGLFGPPVDVPHDAPAFERALGLAGRDPAWTPRG